MKTCPRCGGLCHCPVYSAAAQKFTDDTCPDCDGCGEIGDDEPSPAFDLLGTAAVAIAFILGMWILAIAL